MRIYPNLALGVILTLTGCHSAHIEATLSNRTPDTLTLVEVDYPSASFGTQTLAPGADFHYRFKVLGSGPTTLLWTDPSHHDHKSPGPDLHENDEGRLAITIQPSGPTWDLEPLHK
jgi:hypothetical protein